jgi:hypothetical protein
VAAFNIAANSAGAQVGIVNVAGETKGLQLGLVNYTKEENKGVPIGPVNIARNGRVRGLAWGGSHVAVTGGAKFQIGRLFSLLTLGVGNLNDNISESLTYGFHYGMSFSAGRLTLSPDIGYRWISATASGITSLCLNRPRKSPTSTCWKLALFSGSLYQKNFH